MEINKKEAERLIKKGCKECFRFFFVFSNAEDCIVLCARKVFYNKQGKIYSRIIKTKENKPNSYGKYKKNSYRMQGEQRTMLRHLVIYECFNGKRIKGKEIDHKDGNRINNRIENLQQVTREENKKNYDDFRYNSYIGIILKNHLIKEKKGNNKNYRKTGLSKNTYYKYLKRYKKENSINWANRFSINNLMNK